MVAPTDQMNEKRKIPFQKKKQYNWTPISGRVDRAFATETVDLGSFPGRVKPKTLKIGIHSLLG